MHAVIAREPGPPENLSLQEVPTPIPGPGEVAIEVAATAVNRADTLQRQGYYPPPPGVSEVIGLECSGVVSAVGEGVVRWEVGDEVCALLAGGGYATCVVAPEGQLLPVPANVSLAEAAALPEVAATVCSNVYLEAGLLAGETLLVHGGAGGIGTFAIQLAHALGSRVIATDGGAEKVARCRDLGADVAIDYQTTDFVEATRSATSGGGANVILDTIGGSYLGKNVDALAHGGRLAIIGMQGGTRGELNIGRLMQKRGTVLSTALRPRPVEEKAAICADVEARVWPLVTSGAIRPVIHATFPLAEAAAAHHLLESGRHTGKILLVA
ncbi:NAD(P)H-quinone oxidoreductase [Nocardioides sp. YIM 152315]|uniref:NAD(P)H-quinone oxidoreductase n=1 Tax=Nocardioides sp. YIM 152315 TaxID=3031760 RepID=UPI0023DB736E|nr:NAD(P)H-quinone oxidoreductase [Nocardioides sp. YIM 152315]MDF1602228.1 NAD(P)H-quinone oxidoreductase [Nocardioides sp. YIM 152315]